MASGCLARVSGSASAAQTTTTKQAAETKMKIDCQPNSVSRKPPSSGAIIGAAITTMVTEAIIEAARSR